MTTTEEIASNLVFTENTPANTVAYHISGKPNKESAEGIYIIHNANRNSVSIDLPKGSWNVYVNGEKAGTKVLETIKNGKAEVAPISTMVLVQESSNSSKTGIFVAVGIVAVAAITVGAFATRKKTIK